MSTLPVPQDPQTIKKNGTETRLGFETSKLEAINFEALLKLQDGKEKFESAIVDICHPDFRASTLKISQIQQLISIINGYPIATIGNLIIKINSITADDYCCKSVSIVNTLSIINKLENLYSYIHDPKHNDDAEARTKISEAIKKIISSILNGLCMKVTLSSDDLILLHKVNTRLHATLKISFVMFSIRIGSVCITLEDINKLCEAHDEFKNFIKNNIHHILKRNTFITIEEMHASELRKLLNIGIEDSTPQNSAIRKRVRETVALTRASDTPVPPCEPGTSTSSETSCFDLFLGV